MSFVYFSSTRLTLPCLIPRGRVYHFDLITRYYAPNQYVYFVDSVSNSVLQLHCQNPTFHDCFNNLSISQAPFDMKSMVMAIQCPERVLVFNGAILSQLPTPWSKEHVLLAMESCPDMWRLVPKASQDAWYLDALKISPFIYDPARLLTLSEKRAVLAKKPNLIEQFLKTSHSVDYMALIEVVAATKYQFLKLIPIHYWSNGLIQWCIEQNPSTFFYVPQYDWTRAIVDINRLDEVEAALFQSQ